MSIVAPESTSVSSQPVTSAPLPVPPQPAPSLRTWSFTNRHTGQEQQVTCMPGCTMTHDSAAPMDPEDVWCQAVGEAAVLLVNDTGVPENVRVLSSTLNVMPFSTTIAYRLPHVSIEVMQDAWIEGLDPDGLATVISTLEERVEALRLAHAELVVARAEYRSAG